MAMSWCLPFFRFSERGEFHLTVHPDLTVRRETIQFIKHGYSFTSNFDESIANQVRSYSCDNDNRTTIDSVGMDPINSSTRNTFAMSIENVVNLSPLDNVARQTVSEIVQTNPKNIVTRKIGVISPAGDAAHPLHEINIQKFPKDSESDALIRRAIGENDFLKNLMDEERLQAVVEAMSSQDLTAGSYIIREGEDGSHLYVSAEGQFEVIKGNQIVKEFGPGVAFGELAILYKAKRFASVKASTNAKVWMLERRVFQKIIIRSGRQELEDNVRFLSSVPILQGIHPIELAKIADFLKREFFASDTRIIRQGDKGDKFYIIRGGTVTVSQRSDDGSEEKLKELRRGEYFGEQALLYQDKRLASVTANAPGVECLTLDRGPFTEFLGNLKQLKEVYHARPSTIQEKVTNRKVVINSEYKHIQLVDLEIVGTLGVGGFGRVELVQYKKDRSKTFALKCLKKIEMVRQQQQEHAYNEKHIMINCDSPFICRLYNTYKDSKYLYFLMDALLGGDVWTILQKHRYFNEQIARFMAACVIEAFDYMHSRNMIYRDLKPENLMIDYDGYVKLVDFGFAKQVNNGKTYTFAGTPEYVAPEIVLNKGHDRAVDYWALGIFIHELLAGKPPFRGPDHMRTYNLILKGIDSIQFPPRIGKSAQMLIKRLCRPVPTDRLGYLKNKINDIKDHKWFLGFDWTLLKERKMKAPLIRQVASNTDLSNFAKYSKDKLPPDETSGWDADF